MPKNKINVLECTLRDGSYRIDYQFSADDTAVIAAALENVGFNLIEIGHGLGLGASVSGEGVAAATDEEYLKAASSALKKAKFGTFFIPGIGSENDLKLASDYGMSFVRIGTNATEVHRAENYVKLAKKLEMDVSLNLMKSYALTPIELVKKVKAAKDWGVDIAYVVDSAGGMLPHQVNDYISQLRDNVDIAVGFHGHNNFDLAVANTLSAIESGATYVDCTLQGIGRSAGNAPTEILIMILEKLGYKTGVDALKTMNLGEALIKPLIKKSGISSIDVIEGYALFHSKFLEKVYRVAKNLNVDPRELIIDASKKSSLVDVSEELLLSTAIELAKKAKKNAEQKEVAWSVVIEVDNIQDQKRTVCEVTKEVCMRLSSSIKKNGKTSVFTIASSGDKKESSTSPFIRESQLFVMGNSVVATLETFETILRVLDGNVDVILIDDELKNKALPNMFLKAKTFCKKSRVFAYSDESLLARICQHTIFQLSNDLRGKKLAIFGSEILGIRLCLYFSERGADVVLCDNDCDKLKLVVEGINLIKPSYATPISFTSCKETAAKNAFALVGTNHAKPLLIGIEEIKAMLPSGFIFDAGIGSVHESALEYAMQMGINTYRPDMKAGLSGEILSILETDYQLTSILGRAEIGGISVVAGGILGKKGEVIIDSISHPTTVLGVADGNGGFVDDLNKYLPRIKKVKTEMIRRKMVNSLERAKDNHENSS